MFLATLFHHGVATTVIATARMTTRLAPSAIRTARVDMITAPLAPVPEPRPEGGRR